MVRHPKPSHFHEAELSRTETNRALLPPSKCSQRWEGSQETLRDILRSCGYGCSPAAHCTTATHPAVPAPGLSFSTASPTTLQVSLLLSLDITGVQGPVFSKKSNPNSNHPSVETLTVHMVGSCLRHYWYIPAPIMRFVWT